MAITKKYILRAVSAARMKVFVIVHEPSAFRRHGYPGDYSRQLDWLVIRGIIPFVARALIAKPIEVVARTLEHDQNATNEVREDIHDPGLNVCGNDRCGWT